MADTGSDDISCPIVRASQIRTGLQDRWGRWCGRRGGWTRRCGKWTHRRRRWGWFNHRDLVEILFQSGSPETIRLVIMNSFKTRTIWLRLKERNSLVDKVIVAHNVVNRKAVDDVQSGFPETIRSVIMNSFKMRTIWLRLKERNSLVDEVIVAHNIVNSKAVDDVQSGFLETIRLVIMNHFKTRTIRLPLKGRNSLVDEADDEVIVVVANVCVVVALNVVDRIVVNNDQSGLPETIRLVLMNSLIQFELFFMTHNAVRWR